MLDDFIMDFSWDELEYTIEDLEMDYLIKEVENGKNNDGLLS